MMMKNVLFLDKVTRVFQQGGEKLVVLDQASLQIKAGEMVALVGDSGSGKSTLLQIAGLLDKPSSGNVFISGVNYAVVDESTQNLVRREKLGFVYQFHHLLPEFTALENVAIADMIAGEDKKIAFKKAKSILTDLNLGLKINNFPSEMSGGEQQRVAIARAIVKNPTLLLADEPTGNLDPETSKLVFANLLAMVKKNNCSALIVTHNPQLAQSMDRVVKINHGKIIEFSSS